MRHSSKLLTYVNEVARYSRITSPFVRIPLLAESQFLFPTCITAISPTMRLCDGNMNEKVSSLHCFGYKLICPQINQCAIKGKGDLPTHLNQFVITHTAGTELNHE